MKKITLGRTNERVSVISLGTWSFGKENTSGGSNVGWSNQTDNDSKSALLKAYSSGINHWDTADVYGEGHSEKIIGSMWNELSRNTIFLASKVGWDMGPHPHWYHPAYMKIKMEKSLKNLKTDYVDLMYLHHCNFGKNNEYIDDAAEILYRFREEGKTRFIGLSDWSSKKILSNIEKIDPDVVQPLYNVYDAEYVDSGLKQYVRSNNLGTCYFSPIKHGILTGKYETIVEFPKGDFRRNVKEFKNIDFINKMKENKKSIEERFSNTNSDPILHALLGAILYDNPTACVLLGQRNEQQASVAGKLGHILSEKDAEWVLSLYKD